MSQYRQQQCTLMLEALGRAGQFGMTRKEFAELLGIKKGTHLNELIKELVVRDLAIVKKAKDIHNRPIFVYFAMPVEEKS
jgi:hypothetical protein